MAPPASRQRAQRRVLQNEDHQRLTQRVEQMERSVNRILPFVRKILYTVSERNAAADEVRRRTTTTPRIKIRHDPGFMPSQARVPTS